ncbi:inositol monophosphatase 1-like [Daktulosphaira vitifoliae]|uniref:inositol monophosphatase 1-like n=1 Tax=Daktulosphaira vitifoliae TaxID=58002 RepID=UPI0021A97987|nr:inositol monophosphatase 1-like [Daktulosphaira vitifoliae]XP_050531072.1 inositol monophosphatase 1-like [Daktulosphaira vitifoliae]
MALNNSINLHECLELVTRLSRQAGKLIKTRINQKKMIETKASSIDFVTETDQEVEKMLIEGIKHKYPTHKFIGEESFAAGIKENLTNEPTWVIDPVDGTTNFVHGYPNVCISIGLVIDCEAQLGVIFNPILDMFYRAIKGEGAFLNDEPIHVSNSKCLKDSLVSIEYGSVRTDEFRSIVNHNVTYLNKNAHGIRSGGSAAWNLAMVAKGACDLYVEMGLHAWDMAAGNIIVKEAGGVIIDPAGCEFELMNRRILAAASKELADEIYPNLKQYFPEHD